SDAAVVGTSSRPGAGAPRRGDRVGSALRARRDRPRRVGSAAATATRNRAGGALREEGTFAGGFAMGAARPPRGEARRSAAGPGALGAGGHLRDGDHRAGARSIAVGWPPGRARSAIARRAHGLRGLAAQADAPFGTAAVPPSSRGAVTSHASHRVPV